MTDAIGHTHQTTVPYTVRSQVHVVTMAHEHHHQPCTVSRSCPIRAFPPEAQSPSAAHSIIPPIAQMPHQQDRSASSRVAPFTAHSYTLTAQTPHFPQSPFTITPISTLIPLRTQSTPLAQPCTVSLLLSQSPPSYQQRPSALPLILSTAPHCCSSLLLLTAAPHCCSSLLLLTTAAHCCSSLYLPVSLAPVSLESVTIGQYLWNRVTVTVTVTESSDVDLVHLK